MSVNKTKKWFLKKIEKVLLRSAMSERESAATKILGAGRDLVSVAIGAFPNDAEIMYGAGLVMYYSHTETEDGLEYSSAAARYFQRAIDLDPGHQMAKLYLGHHFFDIEAYEQTLHWLGMLDLSYFRRIDQYWRTLKVRELILACKIYLDLPDLTFEDFIEFERIHLREEDEDVPYPFELANAIFRTEDQSVWKRIDSDLVKKMVLGIREKNIVCGIAERTG